MSHKIWKRCVLKGQDLIESWIETFLLLYQKILFGETGFFWAMLSVCLAVKNTMTARIVWCQCTNLFLLRYQEFSLPLLLHQECACQHSEKGKWCHHSTIKIIMKIRKENHKKYKIQKNYYKIFKRNNKNMKVPWRNPRDPWATLLEPLF